MFHQLAVNEARALAKSPEAKLLRELAAETVQAEAPTGATEQFIDSSYEPGPDVPAEIGAYDGPGLHALSRCPQLGSVRIFRLGEGVDRPDGTEEEYLNCHTPGELAYHLGQTDAKPRRAYCNLLAHEVDADKFLSCRCPGCAS